MTADIINLRDRRDEALVAVRACRERYAAAKRKAGSTLDMDDGLAAAMAFADFVDALRRARRRVTGRDIDGLSSISVGDGTEEVVAMLRMSKRKEHVGGAQ